MKRFVICYLLFVIYCGDAVAAIRIGNQSRATYAAGYNTVAQMQAQQYYAQQTVAAEPVISEVATTIPVADGATADAEQLDACSMIYPGGEFQWATPVSGGLPTCVAMVEMRYYVDGKNDTVLARAPIANGNAIECNIEKFPENSYTAAVSDVVFPADNEPTIDDVKKQMNAEQRKSAGWKIAGAAIVGGVAGNLLTEKNLETGKKNAGNTLIGAASSAGIMTASSYTGKIAGDMILSAGVNATAGGMVGNMSATGHDILRIEDCTINGRSDRCVWGTLQEESDLPAGKIAFLNKDDGHIISCDEKSPEFVGCINISLANYTVPGYETLTYDTAHLEKYEKTPSGEMYNYDEETRAITGNSGGWIRLLNPKIPTNRVAALLPIGTDNRDLEKTFGAKISDWNKWISGKDIVPMGRSGQNTAYALDAKWTVAQFYPIMMDGTDGGLIDINNRARLKSTLIGAGAGAGLGAFTAYQGATDEIDQRWVAAVTEYKDSLTRVYCATGTRWLTQYNDLVVIPNM